MYVHKSNKICKHNRDQLKEKEFYSLTAKKYRIIPKSNDKQGYTEWLCECKCGRQIWIEQSILILNRKKYCGECDNYIWANGPNHSFWKGCGDINHRIFSGIERHAIDRNLDFNITIQDIWDLFLKQNRLCALTGRFLKFGITYKEHKNRETTASLDRIDSNQGYYINNVQWIFKDLNVMKSDFSQNEFVDYCKKIYSYKPQPQLSNFNNDIKICKTYISAAKDRHKKANHKELFNIDMDFLIYLYNKQNRKCIFSGIDLTFGEKQSDMKNHSASIDRINSSQGYTKNNIQLTHKYINLMKQDSTDIYFRQLCSEVAIYCD